MTGFNFNDKKYFKLVLGLGNCSFNDIEQLCGIYSKAGADIFDLSPNIKSLKSAQNGVKKAGLNPYDFYYCISFGVPGDTHIKKAKINTEKCKKCFKCVSRCPQEAIQAGENRYPKVIEEKCIGCGYCKNDCIEFYDKETDIAAAAQDFTGEKLDMVELHISSLDENEILKNWKKILDNFDCQKSICIDRSKYGDKKLKDLTEKMLKLNPKPTIIQADGVPMSGAESLPCTLQAIAHAQIYQNFDCPIFLSGGTNAHTREYADKFDIRYNGITIGTYARSIVKKAIQDNDFPLAVKLAKELVASVKEKND